MKPYTDLEQSKKLAEILPIESADHHYVRKVNDSTGKPVDGKWSIPKYGNPNSSHANYMVLGFTKYETIPCWSLAALLNITPQIKIRGSKKIGYIVYYNKNIASNRSFDIIDACYEMVLKLNGLNLL